MVYHRVCPLLRSTRPWQRNPTAVQICGCSWPVPSSSWGFTRRHRRPHSNVPNEPFSSLLPLIIIIPPTGWHLIVRTFSLTLDLTRFPLSLSAPKSQLQNRLLFHLSHKVSFHLPCHSYRALVLKQLEILLNTLLCTILYSVCCSQFSDEKQLMTFHQNLEDVTEDQLSLASIHYMRSHYQEAIDIYKRILLQNR